MSKTVLVVAGEHSGDMHLAQVVRAVKEQDPTVQFWGMAGDHCQAEGVELAFHADEMAVMGLAEVVRRYPFIKRVFQRLGELAASRKPNAVLLVDYSGFNLRFARKTHELGLKNLYFISPQVWASRPGRIPVMAEVLDRLMVIFPFEPAVFKDTKLPVDFVGHPLVKVADDLWQTPVREVDWPGEKKVALLPGSRDQEIERILPELLGAAKILEEQDAKVGFVVAAASDGSAQKIEEFMETATRKPKRIGMVVNDTREVLRQADAAWVASGTATIETALMKCPMVITYKTSPLTYAVGRRLVRVPHIGMVNIVAGREICPEYLQSEATAEKLAAALVPLLDETPERKAMLEALAEVVEKLGKRDAYQAAAEIILEELA